MQQKNISKISEKEFVEQIKPSIFLKSLKNIRNIIQWKGVQVTKSAYQHERSADL